MDKARINVVALGLDDRSRHILTFAFLKRGNGLCALTDEKDADVALADLDATDISSTVQAFRTSHPDMPVLGIGAQVNGLKIDDCVEKPVNLEQLMIKINTLYKQKPVNSKNKITEDKIAKAMKALESKGVARSLNKRVDDTKTTNSIKRTIPTKTDEMCFNPNRFLLGSVLEAVTHVQTENEIIVLTCWGDKTIVVFPDQDKITSNLTDNQIRNLAIAPVDDNLSSPINRHAYSTATGHIELKTILNTEGMREYSRENFLWNLGLLTCRGRIPTEVSIDELHYLRRWPNLTRVIIPDNAMRIVAYWIQQPCSLNDIREQLDVPFQDVFNVFSAAYSAGLAGMAKRKADEFMGTIELNEHKKRGLLGSIMTRLRGHKTEQLSKTA